MELIKIIILGIIQGLTEFLPISSSGHLVIFQKLFGIEKGQLTLDVFLHFGTVIPVLIIFRNDIRDIILLKKKRLIFLLFLGLIPTGLIGYFFQDFFSKLFSSVLVVGYMLLITALLLYLAERSGKNTRSLNEMKGFQAIIVGIAQGLAVIPGISRSGSTIVASLLQGIDRESAARYSFLLALPTIIGAGLLQLKDIVPAGLTDFSWTSILAGILSAALAGYLGIKCLLHILTKGSLLVFSYYCLTLGLLVIFFAGFLS